MTDKPILFSAPMVRALLAGTKTQTRRILNFPSWADPEFVETDERGIPGAICRDTGCFADLPLRWAVGDQLWVREAWRTETAAHDDLSPAKIHGPTCNILYDEDADWSSNKSTGKARVSIHMPRWASRLTLRVTDVRVERLQDISEDDARAEGVDPQKLRGEARGIAEAFNLTHRPYSSAYANLWNAINGPGAWDMNPWIVALTFEVIRANIDKVSAR